MGGGLTHFQTGTAQSDWPSTVDMHTACRHYRKPFWHQPPEITQFDKFSMEIVDSKQLTESSVPGGLSSPGAPDPCPVCCKKPEESSAIKPQLLAIFKVESMVGSRKGAVWVSDQLTLVLRLLRLCLALSRQMAILGIPRGICRVRSRCGR